VLNFEQPHADTEAMKRLLTVKEVARVLRVSSQSPNKMVRKRTISAVTMASQKRFEQDRIRGLLVHRRSPSLVESVE
jgi:excisionase family DNA binding protein